MARPSKEELLAFEEDIAECFNNKMIKAPVHLSSGNEDQLIQIFDRFVSHEDWVMTSWRSHYQCLLHGVPKEELKQSILDGKSITLSFPKHRVLSSAIVAGILPIATGIALGIKRSGGTNKVIVFVGDMTYETGTFHECHKYAINHKLPIIFVVEDNSLSVCTDTKKTWGDNPIFSALPNVIYYQYKSKWPHAGAGARIQF